VRRLRPSGWVAVHGRRPAGVSHRPKRHEGSLMKRHNIEFLWGWFDALRRRDTGSMAAGLAPDVVWQGVRPELVCLIEGGKIRRIEDYLERSAALAAAGIMD
jgi:hypothetical protein